ncbi:unnamed protein product [Ilex paraguariensis]|uniref:RNA helicase n=1 Tax=Ilex paraguariensis TaxID=185542 RepID=A0ABC8SUG5_9AQUA
MGTHGDKWDEEWSVIGDKGDIGFIDFEDCKSVCSYNPTEESEIVISVPFPLVKGKPQSGFVGDTVVDSITIKNTTSEPVELWSVKIYDSKPEDSFTLSVMEPPTANSGVQYIQAFLESSSLEDRVLRSGQTLTIWLSCKPKEIGLHTSAVHFTVGDETIERLVFLLAEDKISQSLASDKPYHRGKKKKKQMVLDVSAGDAFVVGERPAKPATRGFKKIIAQFPIPKNVRDLVESKQIPDVITEGLTKANYAHYFTTLVIMEEIKMEEDMKDYDMERVSMSSKGSQFLLLEVPGLAEKRPSLVCGDFICATLASKGVDDSTRVYQGYIHRVEAEEVYLKFDKEFHVCHKVSNLYNVWFTFNRLNMRRLYQAIEATKYLERDFLFPSRKRFIQPIPLVPISCMLNEEQISAIGMILGCNGGPPYVVHGPPGTGKTMTIVEAILQLYTMRKNARILVCAPSNNAADHILEKLLMTKAVRVQHREIFRLNALTRSFEDVKPDHISYCFAEEFIFKCPPLRDLMRFKIIISTYTSASLLYAEGIKRGHFSHIFLDEAGQASEPEVMVPLSNLCRGDTVVILAGDPMQLGPVIFSRDAEIYGLGKSYLERLFECKFYGVKNENYVTKLVRNYRCHPAILYLPSQLFYRGELISCKDDDTWSSITWVEILPNKQFPVFFFGVQGFDEREGGNPSWFNRIEASKVVEIIRNLTQNMGLDDEEIGVITPYRQQVLKIKKALESFGCSDIKVGSVEQFQGQERQIIIVSTVRSTVKHNEFDKTYYLGFLSNPRRFNVAITRAKSLLIVIGNPHIICKDPYWNKLLWHCSDNGSYQGCFLPERPEYLDEESTQVGNEDNEGDEKLQPSEYIECAQELEIPKPVTNEAEWSHGWKSFETEEIPKPVTGEAECSHDSKPYDAEEIPEPVMDEAEWSDGWKC